MIAPFARALEAGEDVEQEGVVAVLLGRDAELEAMELVSLRVEAVAPRLGGERWIGDHEVECLEPPSGPLKWGLERVLSLPDFRGRAVVQDHVHPGQRLGGVVHLLPVERKIEAGAALGFVVRFQQQRARAARRVVDGLVGRLALPTPITLAMMRETSAGV